MARILGVANSSRDFISFLNSPIIKTDKKIAVISKLFVDLQPLTAGFIEYTLPVSSNIGGVVLWAPDAYNYGGGDAPP